MWPNRFLNCELNEDSGIDSLIVLEVKITILWVNLCPVVEHGKITRVIPCMGNDIQKKTSSGLWKCEASIN